MKPIVPKKKRNKEKNNVFTIIFFTKKQLHGYEIEVKKNR